MDGNGLRQKFDADAYETARRLRPRSFEQRFATFARLDQHFTRVWLNYVGGLFAREQLDMRTRLLVLTGQYTMTRNARALEDTIQAALDEKVDPRHVLEVILQCFIYTGESPVSEAVEVFVRVVGDAGLLEDVEASSPPIDATIANRSLEEEREQWAQADRDDPRLQPLLDRYGWTGISTGLRLRPRHHLTMLASIDALDPDFLALWLATPYEGLYPRGVLDDRTRLLCVVGNCLSVGETHQSRRHMRAALRQGATGRELLEVVFQSCVIVGHANLMPMALDDIVVILDEEGRLDEIVSPDRADELKAIVQARIARRHGVAEAELPQA